MAQTQSLPVEPGRKESKRWQDLSASQCHRRLKKRFVKFFRLLQKEDIPDEAVVHFLRGTGLFKIITMLKKAWADEVEKRTKMGLPRQKFNQRRRERVSNVVLVAVW